MKLIIALLVFVSYGFIFQIAAGSVLISKMKLNSTLIFFNLLDSITASWTPLLNGLRPYADDVGDHEIDVIISILPSLDEAIDSKDSERALQISKTSVAYTKEKLLPHIRDAKIRKEYSEKMAGMQPLMEKIVKGGDMKNFDKYIVSTGQQGF